ncbi:hypothetical protein [Pedobacter nutrimenti]|uniref:hypothetical protein n=1 Tax=Pedobacter nutrimenti TaxID=1241337 RepID=UPI00292EBF1E|nr:hypothetical protein [Pedobacter nutrimenti]
MSKQGLKYNIQLFVELLDDLENSSLDVPAAVNARVDMAYRSLSGYLFEVILSEKDDLEYKRSVIKKFISSLLVRTFALLKAYGPEAEKSGIKLSLHHATLLEIKASLIRIFHLINYRFLNEIFLEANLVYHRIIKYSL